MNNPLRYNDESGELFGFVTGLFKGIVNYTVGVAQWAFGGESPEKAFKDAWKPIHLGLKIDAGMFIGTPKQILSRWTWERPQSLLGNLWSSYRNVEGVVDQVKYYKGATYVIHDNSSQYRGITLGNYINMDIDEEYTKDKYEPDWNGGKFTPAADNMMMHEYGHYLQSQMIGPFYMSVVGIPSFMNESFQDKIGFYTEKWANNLAYDFFVDPSVPKSDNAWDFNKYPISNPSDAPRWTTGPVHKNNGPKPRGNSHNKKRGNNFKY